MQSKHGRPNMVVPAEMLQSMPKANFKQYMSTAQTMNFDASPPVPSRPASYGRHHLPHQQYQHQHQHQQPAPNPVNALRWSPYGDFIAAADDRVLRVWNAERPAVKLSTELKVPGGGGGGGGGSSVAATAVCWNPARHSELASVGADGVLRLWDFVSAKLVAEARVGPGAATALVWGESGDDLVVCTEEGLLKRISRHTMDTVAETRVPRPTSNLALLPSSDELFVGCENGEVLVYDYPTLDRLHCFTAASTAVTALALSPYSRYLAAGGRDGRVGVWDCRDFVCQRAFDDHTTPVRSVGFSFDDTVLVAGTPAGGLHFNHAELGEHLFHLHQPAPDRPPPPAAAGAEAAATAAAAAAVGAAPVPAGHPHVDWHPRYYALAYSTAGASGLKVVGSLAPM